MVKIGYIVPLVLVLMGSVLMGSALMGSAVTIAYAQTALWYDNGHDPIDCQDNDPLCCKLLSCPLDHTKYVTGFLQLVGWYLPPCLTHWIPSSLAIYRLTTR